MRNKVILAEVHYNSLHNEYHWWLVDEGVLLTEKQVNKAASQFMLDEMVNLIYFLLYVFLIIDSNIYFKLFRMMKLICMLSPIKMELYGLTSGGSIPRWNN